MLRANHVSVFGEQGETEISDGRAAAVVALGSECDALMTRHAVQSGTGDRLRTSDLLPLLEALERVSGACEACLAATRDACKDDDDCNPPPDAFVDSALKTVLRTMATLEYNRMCEPAHSKRGLPMSPKNTLDFVLWNVVAKMRVLLHTCGYIKTPSSFANGDVTESCTLAATGLVAFTGPVSAYTLSELVCSVRVLTEPLVAYGEASSLILNSRYGTIPVGLPASDENLPKQFEDYLRALELRFSEVCSGHLATEYDGRPKANKLRYDDAMQDACGVATDGSGMHPKYAKATEEEGFSPDMRLYALATGASDLLRRFSVVVMPFGGPRHLVMDYLRPTVSAETFASYAANLSAWIDANEAELSCESTTERLDAVLARCLTSRTDKLETQARTGDSDGCDRVRCTRIARQEAAVVLSRMDVAEHLPVCRVLRNAKKAFWADAGFSGSVTMGECALASVFLLSADAFAANLVPKHTYGYMAETDDPTVYVTVVRSYGADRGRSPDVAYVLSDSLASAMAVWLLDCESRYLGLLPMGDNSVSLTRLIQVMKAS